MLRRAGPAGCAPALHLLAIAASLLGGTCSAPRCSARNSPEQLQHAPTVSCPRCVRSSPSLFFRAACCGLALARPLHVGRGKGEEKGGAVGERQDGVV